MKVRQHQVWRGFPLSCKPGNLSILILSTVKCSLIQYSTILGIFSLKGMTCNILVKQHPSDATTLTLTFLAGGHLAVSARSEMSPLGINREGGRLLGDCWIILARISLEIVPYPESFEPLLLKLSANILLWLNFPYKFWRLQFIKCTREQINAKSN